MFEFLQSCVYFLSAVFKYCEFSLVIIGIILGKKMITKTDLEIKLLKQKLALIYEKKLKDNQPKE